MRTAVTDPAGKVGRNRRRIQVTIDDTVDPWEARDIGVSSAGGSDLGQGCLQVLGAGGRIAFGTDEFHFGCGPRESPS